MNPQIKAALAPVIRRIPAALAVGLLTWLWKLRWLLLAVGLYWAAPYAGIRPLSASDAAIGFDDLDRDVKIALGTAIVTAVGFITAFATAHYTWRSERIADLRMRAADDLFDFAQAAKDSQTKLRLGLERLSELAVAAQDNPVDSPPVRVALLLAREALAQCHHAVPALRKAGTDIFALDSKYQVVAGLHAMSAMSLRECAVVLGELGVLAVVPLPPLHLSDDELVAWCRRSVDLHAAYLERSDELAFRAIAEAGAFRGVLLGPIIKPSGAGLSRLISDIRRMGEKA